MSRQITKEEFTAAAEALWTEIEYQNTLQSRTDESETKQVSAFITATGVYVSQAKTRWAFEAGDEAALHSLRKIAAVAFRGMIYCGIRKREKVSHHDV